eukprot:gene3157-2139_t
MGVVTGCRVRTLLVCLGASLLAVQVWGFWFQCCAVHGFLVYAWVSCCIGLLRVFRMGVLRSFADTFAELLHEFWFIAVYLSFAGFVDFVLQDGGVICVLLDYFELLILRCTLCMGNFGWRCGGACVVGQLQVGFVCAFRCGYLCWALVCFGMRFNLYCVAAIATFLWGFMTAGLCFMHTKQLVWYELLYYFSVVWWLYWYDVVSSFCVGYSFLYMSCGFRFWDLGMEFTGFMIVYECC